MNEFIKGATYILHGFQLIHRKGIRHFAYIPIAINTVLFSIAIWISTSYFSEWLARITPSWLPQWLLDWVLWPVFFLLLAVIVFFSFSIVANLLTAPFNGVLAEAVEDALTGQKPQSMDWPEIIKDAPGMIWNEVRKLLYVLLWLIPLFILSWIPGINLVAPVLWTLFSAWMLALDYHDYPMGNHQLKFPQQRSLLRQRRWLALGFGLAALAGTMIPVVNFLIIPAAVAGATALFLREIQPNS